MMMTITKVNMELMHRMSMRIYAYDTISCISLRHPNNLLRSHYRPGRFLEMSTADICSGYKNTSSLRIHIAKCEMNALPS